MSKKAVIPNQSLQIPKTILLTATLLQAISSKLATRFAAQLFITPLKHKIPKRELHMEKESRQTKLSIPKIKKKITVYEYGSGEKKVLLVHGWSGRGTQLVKIADELVALGYTVVSFDAPAHGKSDSKTTLMPEFIAAILELHKTMGPFEVVIGHSLGGMSILNAIKQNLKVKKAVIIGSGDIVRDIIADFIKALGLKPKIGPMMKNYFENRYGEPMESYNASGAAIFVANPVLVIHDTDDPEISVSAAHNIHKHLKNGELFITHQLGHRKILGDKAVIEKIKAFITN
ncbi:alpha/beta fold hydrolase [Flavobacterium phycosphaerae]|uniref:alpha/beta fold hydrolase n=1 Tax=Flavobacterium phycosphaerae TaxID=2697515 RepID=UPI001389A60B|nr:alpha/beta hydrolase [Flavobacterium phycosphaerae]